MSKFRFPWSRGGDGHASVPKPPTNPDAPITRGDLFDLLAPVVAHFAHKERAYRREQRMKWGFMIGLLFILYMLFSSVSSPGDAEIEVNKKPVASVPHTGSGQAMQVAIIPVSGEINGDILGPKISANTTLYLKEALELAERQSHMGAVVLYINSPGGDAVASAQSYRLVKRFREKTKIPVYAFVSSRAFSGGYYIALGADKIIVDPEAQVGSIGVVIRYMNMCRLGEVIGIGEEVISSGPNKAAMSQWNCMSKDSRVMVQRSVDQTFKNFVTALSESRHIPLETLLLEARSANGRTSGSWYSAEDAVRMRLADRVLAQDELYETLQGEIVAKHPNAKRVDFVRFDKKLSALEGWKDETRATLASMRALFDTLSMSASSRAQVRAE